MTKDKAGDFGKLFRARSTPQTSDAQTSKSSDVRKQKLSKSKDPEYQRTTIYLPKDLHRRLKAEAVVSDREISDIVETLVAEWLESRKLDI